MRKLTLLSLLSFALLLSIPLASAQTISVYAGNSVTISDSGASGGVPPYSYQWYNECPSCGTFNSIAGATQLSYAFPTTANTMVGTWLFKLLASDSVGTTGFSSIIVVSVLAVPSSNYQLPTIDIIIPAIAHQGISTTFNANVIPGNALVANIIWNFQNSYFTNLAYDGSNYQAYDFPSPGFYNMVVQICDVNQYCSSTTKEIQVLGIHPNSYWTISTYTAFGTKITTANIPTYGLLAPNTAKISLTFQPQNDTNPISTVTFDWGDGGALSQTVYTSGVTSDTYYHNYASLGNYTVVVDICDTIGDCNSTTLLYYDYKQTLPGSLTNALLNTNPNIPTTTWLGQIGDDFSSWGGHIVADLIEVIIGGFIAAFIFIFGLGYARQHKYIK